MADQGPLVPGELKTMRSRVGPGVQKAQASEPGEASGVPFHGERVAGGSGRGADEGWPPVTWHLDWTAHPSIFPYCTDILTQLPAAALPSALTLAPLAPLSFL